MNVTVQSGAHRSDAEQLVKDAPEVNSALLRAVLEIEPDLARLYALPELETRLLGQLWRLRVARELTHRCEG